MHTCQTGQGNIQILFFDYFSSECIGSRDPYCVWNSTGLSCEESPLSAVDDMTGTVSAEYVYPYWCIPDAVCIIYAFEENHECDMLVLVHSMLVACALHNAFGLLCYTVRMCVGAYVLQ